MDSPSVAIIGAGPAGLTAGYLLAKAGAQVTIFETDPVYVGGISRTVEYKGFRFDIGGHRFFSKSKEVEDFWDEILPHDMLVRPRSSRIFYRDRFFSYPLQPFEALFKLGIWESALCMLSYLYARMFPVRDPRTFEDWVSNHFGRRLFRIFFKTYTEKVWGMSCREISADWAAQRIKGLSLSRAVLGALSPRSTKREGVVKTLINSFRYPRKGPGMMWEECARKIESLGGKVHMGHRVTACSEDHGTWRVTTSDGAGQTATFQAAHLISSTAIHSLGTMLDGLLSPASQKAAASLKYRDFLTVALVCRHQEHFTDNWIYIHDPRVRVGRIQNFKSWSPEMVPDESHACYGLEYFCFEGDSLWTSPDKELIRLATEELLFLGLVKDPAEIVDASVVRQKKAYPVYDDQYAGHVQVIRDEIEKKFPTLHLVGRNGMHKYNNQDHSMMTAMLTARNILAGAKLFDVWNVNEDAEYHEAGPSASGLRLVPTRAS